METVYIAVEKNIEVFELYNALWKRRRINGIMAASMSEAIEKAAVIKNSKTQYLYFISVSADDIDYITVRVTDTGCGVPSDILPRVFERGVSGGCGTGYGLYICKTIVEAHGGAIMIDSFPSEGTTVTFAVPVYGGQEAGHNL